MNYALYDVFRCEEVYGKEIYIIIKNCFFDLKVDKFKINIFFNDKNLYVSVDVDFLIDMLNTFKIECTYDDLVYQSEITKEQEFKKALLECCYFVLNANMYKLIEEYF